MQKSPVTLGQLPRSVLAVPPLCRRADYSLDETANRALIDHLLAGGIRTLMYGGNANFYNLPASHYRPTVSYLAEATGNDVLVIPSAGPDYGHLMDQAPVLRELGYPTAMILPASGPLSHDGVERGVRAFVEAFGNPAILYIKNEGMIAVENVRRLIDDGLVIAIKYAVVRDNPAKDDLLRALCQEIDPRHIISGIGERPVIDHFQTFGLGTFTSGSVCIAPRASMEILRVLTNGDLARAKELRTHFLPLEDLRDAISPLQVIHAAVRLAGIADSGEIMPLLSRMDATHEDQVNAAARTLLAFNESLKESLVA